MIDGATKAGLSLIILGLLAGCAASPEAISAAYISPTTYDDWSCDKLALEARRLDAAYASAAAQQKKARTNDTVGIILLGLPVSSMSGGNVAPQIADLKGRKNTLEQTQITNNCIA